MYKKDESTYIRRFNVLPYQAHYFNNLKSNWVFLEVTLQ